jgi:hypothetical protein
MRWEKEGGHQWKSEGSGEISCAKLKWLQTESNKELDRGEEEEKYQYGNDKSPSFGLGYEDPKGEIDEREENISQIYQKIHFSLLSKENNAGC